MLKFDHASLDAALAESEIVDIEFSLRGLINAKLPIGINKNDPLAISVWAIRYLASKMDTEEGIEEIVQNLFIIADGYQEVDLNCVTAQNVDAEIDSLETYYYKRKHYHNLEEHELLENQLTKHEFEELQNSMERFKD